jgi:S-adenosylmethionine:tRNA ribosyltransferase-isomerase
MIKDININDFNYNLPDERIAKHPLKERDASKLLVYNKGQISDYIFRELPNLLPSNSLLLLNNTKVIRARLIFFNKNNARIEVFCLEPYPQQPIEQAMQNKGTAYWICTIGNLKRWKDEILIIENENIKLTVEKIRPVEDAYLVKFTWYSDNNFSELLELLGKIPLPPYLKREDEPADSISYQTVYAQVSGSVAAPTAGLHFTPTLINNLQNVGHKLNYVTLHVGAGTFKPIKADAISEHIMHAEEIIINQALLKEISEHNGVLVSVGTTTLRTLESIYWISHLIIDKEISPKDEFYYLSQWAAYGLQKEHSIPFKLSCLRLLHYMQKNQMPLIKLKTQIIIAPGYRINTANALITNFHQPCSTLLLLIACFVGADNWKIIYEHALKNNYRFLSYGDSSLLFRSN